MCSKVVFHHLGAQQNAIEGSMGWMTVLEGQHF